MKKFFLLTKTLLVLALLCVGASNAWGEMVWQLAWADYFEDAAAYKTNASWSSENSITISQQSRNDGVSGKSYHGLDNTAGGRTLTYGIGKAYTASGTSWQKYTFAADEAYKLEFDAAFRSSRKNSGGTYNSTFTIPGLTVGTFGTGSTTATFTAINDYSTTIKSGDNLFTVNVYQDNSSTSDANVSGYFYHYIVEARSTGTTLTVYGPYSEGTYSNTPVYTGTLSASKVDVSQLICFLTRYYVSVDLDNVQLYKEVDAGVCEDPTYRSTGANGNSRKFTLACETANSTVYYSETELAAGADGWTEYTGEVTTSAATLYAYAATTAANSNVISITTGAGSAVKLVAPTITRNAYETVTITADQSSLGFDVTPVPTIYYTYGGEAVAYSGPITITGDGTITAYASLAGYTTSDNATSRQVGLYPQAQIENTPQNKSYSSAALSGNTFTTSKATYDALVIDGNQWGKNVYVQTTKFSWRTNKDWYIDSVDDTWICVKNLKAGEVVVCDADYVASSLVNATYSEKYSYGKHFAYVVTEDGDIEIALKKPNNSTMCYFFGIYAYSDNYVPVAIGEYGYRTFSNTNNLDFTNVEGLTAYIATARDDVNSTIRMKEVSEIITNTGLVLKGDEGTYNIPISATSGTTYNTSSTPKNYLFAISSDYDLGTSGTGTNYVLSVQEINSVETVVWAPITSNENKASVKAGQAALWIPTAGTSSARGLRMVFDGDVITGVESVEAAEAAEKDGKFVINGQLVIKKNGKMFNAAGAQMK